MGKLKLAVFVATYHEYYMDFNYQLSTLNYQL